MPVPTRRVRAGRSAVLVLDAVAAAVGLMAVALLVWPTRPTVPPAAPRIVAEQQLAASGAAESLTQPIVDGNLFSATRRAPTVLFRPPGSEGDAMAPAMPPDALPSEAAPEHAPRLFGIVAQDGVRRALLLLPGADSVPRLLGVGDRRAGWRVVTIGTDRVVLLSAGGTRTVRLVAPAPPDSLELKP